MRRTLLAMGAGLFAVGAAALVGLALGPAGIPPRRVFSLLLAWLVGGSAPGTDATIIIQLRLPRIVLGGAIGAGLAAAGAAFQAILGNPLADPYVIGVSAGAGLGAALGMTLGLELSLLGLNTIPLLAFLGALVTVILVYTLAHVGGGVDKDSLILAGVAVGAFLTACISLLMVFFRRNLDEVVFWLMGGLSGRDWRQVYATAPYILAGGLGLLALARDLNAISLGEEHAAHLGVNVVLTRNLVLAFGSLLAAAAVSAGGIIGFVGLMVPHMARLIVGADLRRLLPFAALFGAAFLIIADTLARVAASPIEIPVGAITALAGGPFFLWLLRRKGTPT